MLDIRDVIDNTQMLRKRLTRRLERMPIFEFRCLACGECFETLMLKKSDEIELRCPKCASEELERILSKTCFAMGSGGGEKQGVASQSRTCSGGSCTTWEIPGHSR
jgi:putative FmdB family regulatory protein